jgi:hypothetical protein
MNPFVSHGHGVRLIEVCAKSMADHPEELIAGTEPWQFPWDPNTSLGSLRRAIPLQFGKLNYSL